VCVCYFKRCVFVCMLREEVCLCVCAMLCGVSVCMFVVCELCEEVCLCVYAM
jgi:hypothetical protein